MKGQIPDGCIFIARIILDSSIWRDDPHILKLFIYLIIKARYLKLPKKYPKFIVKRGELVSSLSQIADDNEYYNKSIKKWSRTKVSRMIELLKKRGFIEVLADTYGTHIKIRNYDDFQDLEKYKKNDLADSCETVVKQLRNSCETDADIYNKDIKDNKGKKEKNKEKMKIPPQIEQVKKFIKDNGYNVNPDIWWNSYQAKGWMIGKSRMVDWKAAVRTWTKGEKKKRTVEEVFGC